MGEQVAQGESFWESPEPCCELEIQGIQGSVVVTLEKYIT